MKALHIDIETFSSEDLSRSGAYRYAEAPDFRILLFGYSVDGGPVRVVDLASGESLPPEVLSALTDDSVLKWAFNASFERVCLSRYLRDLGVLGSGFLPPVSWRCTMISSAYIGLPLSLASVGEVLGLDKQKLEAGKDLIRLFCRPCEPSLLNGQQTFNPPSAAPEKWKLFKEYNCRDVEAELGIFQRISKYLPPDSVWKEYAMDQEINDRGIRVDRELVRQAIHMDDLSHGELAAEMSRRTDLANPDSVAQVRRWLSDHGTHIASMGKKDVQALLASASPEIREVLLLRQQLAKSSVKKYQAMENCVCADGRIRGMFQFYGASRSGRWAGRNVQLQNLPQNHMPDLAAARSLVRDGFYPELRLLYDSVPDTLSELIRTAFIPAPGKKFIVSDFSAVEARVLAWIAGETWRQEVFASGGDIYCSSASRMFRVPVEKHGVNGHLRQKGKIAELALGYGGSVGAPRAMGALEMGVQEEELQQLVNAWRQANPAIVKFWWDVDRAVVRAITTRGNAHVGCLDFSCASGLLRITLPSGRQLSYVKPRLTENGFGRKCISYMGLNTAHKWDRIESYGPKFVENIVQGISRDLLCFAMETLSDLSIVAHVHDEVILEAPQWISAEDVAGWMSETPKWAKGLLLKADAYECEWYRKD